MSRTKKPEKGARTKFNKGKPETKDMGFTKNKRHHFGSTEKILRRNRKIWTRLLNKQRRALDKKATKE